MKESLTGIASAPGEWVGRTFLSYEGVASKVLTRLPLHGHLPARAPGLYRWVRLALAELETKSPRRYRFIQDWCSLIVWLTRDPRRPPGTELTSVALPSFPHCTFLTSKAIKHIPPNIITPAVTLYALQENLFHEALHQQLSATLLLDGMLARPPVRQPKIFVPWRNTSWPLDRALHAAWVYSHLVEMRADELIAGPENPGPMKPMLHRAVSEATVALRHLSSSVLAHRELLTARAQAMVEAIEVMIDRGRRR